MNGSTLKRLSGALDITVSDLLGEPIQAQTLRSDEAPREATDDVIAIRIGQGNEPETDFLREEALKYDTRILANEIALGLHTHLSMPLVFPYGVDESVAELLARDMRQALGIGCMPVGDLDMILEMRGVRIISVKCVKTFQSISFYNKSQHSLIIVLNSENTRERNRYRLVYELGSAVVFAMSGYCSFRDECGAHRLLRRFVDSFLMPEETMRMDVARYGIKPGGWTMDILLELKKRFAVSAETYALRLESLGLIDPALRMKFRAELRSYYKLHSEDMEPESKLMSKLGGTATGGHTLHGRQLAILEAVMEASN